MNEEELAERIRDKTEMCREVTRELRHGGTEFCKCADPIPATYGWVEFPDVRVELEICNGCKSYLGVSGIETK